MKFWELNSEEEREWLIQCIMHKKDKVMKQSKATKEQVLEKIERLHQDEKKLTELITQCDLIIEHNKNKKISLGKKVSKKVLYRNMIIEQLASKNYIN